MDPIAIFDTPLFTWVVLPILIFAARLCDVSLGTIRIVFISHGIKYLAPVIGFFEVSIWLLAIGQIFQHLNNIACYIAYAGGFATGTLIGLLIEERLSIGLVLVRIITKRDPSKLIEALASANYGLTIVNAEGVKGPVHVILTVIRREDLQAIISIIKQYNPTAFYSIEEVKSVQEAMLPVRTQKHQHYRKVRYLFHRMLNGRYRRFKKYSIERFIRKGK